MSIGKETQERGLDGSHLPGADWVVRQVFKNLAMHLQPIASLRKRFYSHQNDPVAMLADGDDPGWGAYWNAMNGLNLSVLESHILEIGPGPLLTNGIRFIAEGAASYTALDRFDVVRRDRVVKSAYRDFILHLSPQQQARCRGLVAEDDVRGLFDGRIECIVTKIEDVGQKTNSEKRWDLIVSFDVLEHVDDLGDTLRSIRRLLKPGGVMIHRVDVAAHNVRPDIHRLAHLVFSERTWRLVSSKRAISNRLRPSQFLIAGDQLGFETVRFEPTTLLSAKRIDQIRPKLWRAFTECSVDDLAILDFVWIAKLNL